MNAVVKMGNLGSERKSKEEYDDVILDFAEVARGKQPAESENGPG